MAPKQSYIVASSPRTGSYLLCEGLECTGIAGRPTEVFSPEFQWIWRRRWALGPAPSFEEYFAAVVRHGTTSNGVYGLKIHWMHVGALARQAGFSGNASDVLEHFFPGAAYIRIVRRDRRAQALSFFRARATNEWWRIDGVPNDQSNGCRPVFDAGAILALEAEVAGQDLAWEQYLRERAIQPMVIEYEALTEDYRGQVARALSFLGLDPRTASNIPPPRLVRQSDTLTDDWRRLLEVALEKGERDGEIEA
jgi:trehalose 2-sulfotransferase